MIQAVRIELNRAEGPSSDCGRKEFAGENVWDRANAQLRAWCLTAPNGGGYDKTDFTVHYADGNTYGGRCDLTRNGEDSNVGNHIRDFCTFYTGKRRPAHMSEERYAAFIAQADPETVASTADFLSRYEIG